MEFVQNRAKEIGMLPIKQRKDELYKMDKEMIERNLSPAVVLIYLHLLILWQSGRKYLRIYLFRSFNKNVGIIWLARYNIKIRKGSKNAEILTGK